MSIIFCQVARLYCHAPVLGKKLCEFKTFKHEITFKICKYINGNHTEKSISGTSYE